MFVDGNGGEDNNNAKQILSHLTDIVQSSDYSCFKWKSFRALNQFHAWHLLYFSEI